jgi:hypothetical protein
MLGERNSLILCVVFLVGVSGCVGEEVPEAPPATAPLPTPQPPEEPSKPLEPVEEKQPSKLPTVEFEFARKIEVGDGIFSGILFVDDRFYVSFESMERVYVKEYTREFAPTGRVYQLTGDGVSDHQLVFADGYFYLVYSVPREGALYLKKLDRDWNEVRAATVVSNAPEPITDMMLSHAGGFLYIGTAFFQPSSMPPVANQRIWRYSTDLKLVDEFVLADVPSEIGSSMLYVNETFIIVSSDRFWGDSSLIVMRYDANWSFMDSRIISAAPMANERFPMGATFVGGRYYVSYTHQTGDISPPPPGELPPDYGDIILKAFDREWNLLGEIKVTDDLPANSANRAHLVAVDDRIYVSYDTRDFKIIVKEYLIRES